VLLLFLLWCVCCCTRSAWPNSGGRVAKKRPYWLCRCGSRNQRIKQKCECGRSRPKPRVTAHAKTLRDDPYRVYIEAAEQIHGVTDESCCVCGKPRSQERHHDRDHSHRRADVAYGKPRGLACGGNQGCNVLMVSALTLERARLITAYLERVDVFYRAASRPDRAGREKSSTGAE
jgi:hypothetical protein